jgi:hypothetical protein
MMRSTNFLFSQIAASITSGDAPKNLIPCAIYNLNTYSAGEPVPLITISPLKINCVYGP